MLLAWASVSNDTVGDVCAAARFLWAQECSTHLATMLVAAPVMVLLGFLWPVGRVVVLNDCDLSAWPFRWPLVWPLRAPLDADFLGFFARPLAWAAIVVVECQPVAAARVSS
jgi:hypothetical protein